MARRPIVCVAMSGGVDSAVVAALLAKRGYQVVGVTMQIWQESQKDPRHSGCCSLGAVEDARRAAHRLGIDHYVINFKDAFKATVIDEFVDEYMAGRTPNPCVTCNKAVKFDALLNKSRELGCDILATGHYARIRHSSVSPNRLMRSVGKDKDQSYVLYGMSQDQLRSVWFPLGTMKSKDETRALARHLGLSVADKPDSQEICFVSEAGGYRSFLKKARPEAFVKGELVSTSGQVIGEHDGVANFTVGQRKGLGIAVGTPLYVLRIDPQSNRVVLGEDKDLEQTEVFLDDFHWTSVEPLGSPTRVYAKIRYNMVPKKATLHPGNHPKLVFDAPVRSVTPGQIAVAYRGETVVGGGKIR